MQEHVGKALLLLVALVAGCGGGSTAGHAASDFQSLADFTENPLVQQLLSRGKLLVHEGDTPPDLEGFYEATRRFEIHDTKPGEVGQSEQFEFRLFGQLNEHIVFDDYSTIGVAESRTLVTGSGQAGFTLWHVAAYDLLLADCQVVVVRILTGTRRADGDLDIRSGQTIVGWSGSECSLLGDPAPLGSTIVAVVDAAYHRQNQQSP